MITIELATPSTITIEVDPPDATIAPAAGGAGSVGHFHAEVATGRHAFVREAGDAAWEARRLRAPSGVVIHHGDVPKADRAWFGPVPVTAPRRTLVDSARDHVSPELLQQATRQATKRGLVVKHDLAEVRRAVCSVVGRPPRVGAPRRQSAAVAS